MPIFEYKCSACETQFEALVAHSDAKTACPQCASDAIEKLLSTFSAAVATTPAPSPCASGGCPSAGMAGSGCGTGGCPMQ